MRLSIAKIVMRIIGTLAGLLGVGMLCVTLFMLFHSISERKPLMILWSILPLSLAAYFIYAAYLVWLRFSPLAVRHICGALGFYVLTLVTKLLDPVRDSNADWPAFAFLGCLVIVYAGYRVVSERLNRWLFPESVSRVQL